tara:strand:- start:254 stop:454 length:201 start_codon:yes stop_codon:yes gene_type:complete
MKHDSESQIQPITTDPLTGEYKLTIPEWMINEYGWYEGMNLEWFIDVVASTYSKRKNENLPHLFGR